MTNPLVLCYHAVSRTWPAALAIAPHHLDAHLRRFLRAGYVPTTFTKAVSGDLAGTSRVLAVTFDDAYRSTHALALPVLAALGVPATVFVPTRHIGSPEPMAWSGIDQWVGTEHEDELLCVSESHLAALAGAGWEIGSHTRTHPRLTNVAQDVAAAELRGSREDLEAITGGACASIAYPYGDHSASVVELARQAGYTAAAALRAPAGHPELLRWPRVGVYRDDPWVRIRLKTSPIARELGLAGVRHPVKALRDRNMQK